MYLLFIYLYIISVRFAALFHKKAQKLVEGHALTWRLLKERIEKNQSYTWIHAASLGEFEQGRPLIERLRERHPESRILLTFFSPSGYEIRKNYGGADLVCYLPFDTPLNVRRFFRLVRIERAFFIKYEFWKYYIAALNRRKIPVYSVSSIFRPNQIFFRWYGVSYTRTLRHLTHFFVQNETSKKLLGRLGITDVSVVGDTRFDRVLDIRRNAKEVPVVRSFCEKKEAGQHILIAGSSWEQDEDILLTYFNEHPSLKLVLAPHVISEDHLASIEKKLTRPAVRFTHVSPEALAAFDCLIIDCYGLLSSIYRYADAAYVGGGFGAGIHNVPEAAVYGVPVFIGPNNKKFLEAQILLQRGSCIEISNEKEFVAQAEKLFSSAEELLRRGQFAESYIQENAGAAEKIFNILHL